MDTDKEHNIDLLQQIHSKQLAIASQDVFRLQTFVKDYETLVETLSSLPNKNAHKAMIPLGGAALVPGELVHTNEVLVLLGDNWFASRTAAQAKEIALRRLADCQEKLKSAEHACKLQEHWIDKDKKLFHDPGYDIVEHVSEEEYLAQKELHKQMVKSHYANLKKLRGRKNNTASDNKKTSISLESSKRYKMPYKQNAQDDRSFEELMQRLDELEQYEEEEEDISDIEGVVMSGSEDDGGDSESGDDDDSSDSEEENEAPKDVSSDDEEEDEPAELNKFRNVKIESPMPSSGRKFRYGASKKSEGPEEEEAEMDDVADISSVQEEIRGRTRSFTRTSTDSETGSGDNNDDNDSSKAGKGQAFRRVSWADQNLTLGSVDTEAVPIEATGTVKIKYTASLRKESLTKKLSYEATEEALPESPDDELGSPTSPTVNTPAELVNLASVAKIEKEEFGNTVPECKASPNTRPKKSILKKTPSRDYSSFSEEGLIKDEPDALATAGSSDSAAVRSHVVCKDDVEMGKKTDQAEPPKRISKFKASRLNQ